MLLNVFVITWLVVLAESVPQTFREKHTDLGNANTHLCRHYKMGQLFFNTGVRQVVALGRKTVSLNVLL